MKLSFRPTNRQQPGVWRRSYEKLIGSYNDFRPFTAAEAWGLFRLAAIGEAVGWTLLIIGVGCQHLPVSWNQIPVQLAGRIHGTLFLLYITAVVVLSPSLGWSLMRTLMGGAASVPPYGSLMFELWAGNRKRQQEFVGLLGLVRLAQLPATE